MKIIVFTHPTTSWFHPLKRGICNVYYFNLFVPVSDFASFW